MRKQNVTRHSKHVCKRLKRGTNLSLAKLKNETIRDVKRRSYVRVRVVNDHLGRLVALQLELVDGVTLDLLRRLLSHGTRHGTALGHARVAVVAHVHLGGVAEAVVLAGDAARALRRGALRRAGVVGRAALRVELGVRIHNGRGRDGGREGVAARG